MTQNPPYDNAPLPNTRKQSREGAPVVFETPNWSIHSLMTFEGAKAITGQCGWCTRKSEADFFMYCMDGKLFTFTKAGNRRPSYQLHVNKTSGRHEFKEKGNKFYDIHKFSRDEHELKDWIYERVQAYQQEPEPFRARLSLNSFESTDSFYRMFRQRERDFGPHLINQPVPNLPPIEEGCEPGYEFQMLQAQTRYADFDHEEVAQETMRATMRKVINYFGRVLRQPDMRSLEETILRHHGCAKMSLVNQINSEGVTPYCCGMWNRHDGRPNGENMEPGYYFYTDDIVENDDRQRETLLYSEFFYMAKSGEIRSHQYRTILDDQSCRRQIRRRDY